jgi:alkaline phosphatase
MQFSIDADGSQPTLAELVAKGIELLDSPDGFFIMCEGGRVDYAGHSNDAATNLRDVIALDDAVKVALKFAERHPDETLVITSGDHETGGLSMGFAGTGGKFKVELLANQKRSADWLSTTAKSMLRENTERPFSDMLPILEEQFGFVFDKNSDSPMKVSDEELKSLKSAFEADRKRIKNNVADTTAHDEPRRYAFGGAARRVMAAHAGIGWSSGSHTALPTLTTAQGAGADVLVGMTENSDIGKRLKKLLEK